MGAEEQVTAHLGRQEGASTSQPGLLSLASLLLLWLRVAVMKTTFCEAAL